MDRNDVDQTTFGKHLALEARTALERGGLLSALLGLAGGGAVVAMMLSGAASNVDSAAVFAFAAGLYSVVFYLLARAGRLKGLMLYVAFMPFVSLPPVFFLMSHFQMPAGAATFLTGPISYLYFQQKERISRLFGQYVSPEVKDRIVGEKAEVSGERKSVVVLFSDLRGLPGFSEGHDA